jgi:hypothetical protein
MFDAISSARQGDVGLQHTVTNDVSRYHSVPFTGNADFITSLHRLFDNDKPRCISQTWSQWGIASIAFGDDDNCSWRMFRNREEVLTVHSDNYSFYMRPPTDV